jgi:hypothetical protein
LLARELAGALGGVASCGTGGEDGNVMVAFSRGSRRGEGLARYCAVCWPTFLPRYAPLETSPSTVTACTTRRAGVSMFFIGSFRFTASAMTIPPRRRNSPQMGGVVFDLVRRLAPSLINPPPAFPRRVKRSRW